MSLLDLRWCLCLLLFSGWAWGQTPISGVVKDPQGAVVPVVTLYLMRRMSTLAPDLLYQNRRMI